jgi:hypothetical protein
MKKERRNNSKKETDYDWKIETKKVYGRKNKE